STPRTRCAADSLTPRASCRSEEHTSELQSLRHLVCRLLLEKKKRRQACTSKPFMSGIHTSRIATRHEPCSSLARKAAGWLNFSTINPAEFINRPSALSMETSSSRSQIPSQAEALTGEPLVSKFALGMPNPVLFIHN